MAKSDLSQKQLHGWPLQSPQENHTTSRRGNMRQQEATWTSPKTFVGAYGSIDSIAFCCQCIVKIKIHFLVPQIEALQHCLCALACACFSTLYTWSQSPCPMIIKLGGTAKYSKTWRFSEAMTRKAENIGSLRSKIGKFTCFFCIDYFRAR